MAFVSADVYRATNVQADFVVDGKTYIPLEQRAETCWIVVERGADSPAPLLFLDVGASPTYAED